MILYGTGPFLLKVFETAAAIGRTPKAYFSEPIEFSPPLPIPLLGSYDATYRPEVPIILAFLDNTHRRNLFRRVRHPLDSAIIHPTAQVDPSARIGPGTFIGSQACIKAGASIGALVVVEEGTLIEAGASIAEGTYIGPSCEVASETVVGAYAYLGAGAVIRPASADMPLCIGEGTIIGSRVQVRNSHPPFSWIAPEKPQPDR